MKVTKSRMTQLIKEELSKAQQKLDLDDDGEIEGSDLAGLRSGKKDKDVGSDKANENIARIVQEEYSKYLNEGGEVSRLITKLEDIGGLVSFAVKEIDFEQQPEVGERLERADQLVTELFDELHDFLKVDEETKPHEEDRRPPDTPEDRIRK